MRLGPTYLNEQDPVRDARRYMWYSSGSPHRENKFDSTIGPITYGYTANGIGSQGGWIATARDLARFTCATDKLPNHSDCLSTNSINQMEGDLPLIAGSYVHGWRRDNSNGRLAHSGNIGFGAAYLHKNTNGVNVAVTCNTGNSDFCQQLALDIWSEITGSVRADIPQFCDRFGGGVQLQSNP